MSTASAQSYFESSSINLFHWFFSIFIGTAITLLFFLVLPTLKYRDPDNPEPIIQLEFIPWQKVQTTTAKIKAVKKPTHKAKPRPVRQVIPRPKSKQETEPKPDIKPESVAKPKPSSKPAVVKKSIPEPPPVPQKITKPVEQNPPPPVINSKPVPAENALPEPIPIFQLSNMPRFMHKVIPVYPKILKHRGITRGNVTLSVLIDARGKVRDIQVLKSSHPEFAQAAIDAIKECSFKPADVRGKPVATRLKIPFKFRLQ